MDRRRFVAAGAGIVAVTATGAVAGVLGVTSRGAGERVTMSGWISAARRGPGHYFVLGPDASVRDPAATEVEQWPQHLTLVLPSDAATLRAGRVTLQGRLYRGKVVDLPTGHFATSVLTDATLV